MATAAASDPDDPTFRYDDLGYFGENAAEYDLDYPGPPPVERRTHRLPGGPALSALHWGDGTPEVVFLHGGAQNAHTWDTVLLAMGRPGAVALDLPGHGHSERREDGRYDPRTNAGSVIDALDGMGVRDVLLVGMSLGGLTANTVAARRPDLVGRLVVIDVTPGVDRDKAKEVVDFIAGPQAFPSFGEILARTIQFNPTRSESSLRRGILHNAHRMPDGSWEWNYDRRNLEGVDLPSMGDLWEDVSEVACPYLLLRGSLSPVVDDNDVAELRRRRPDARVVVVDGAGHSIQGDRPVELASILRDELSD